MLFATGDTHGDFGRFSAEIFPEQNELGREDFVLICGDFGGVWSGDKKEQRRLDKLEALPFTTLWIDGNHENYDRLQKYPVEEWNGGKIQRIRPHILHLMRGQVFKIDGHTLFTMGGASSHDISDGILNPWSPDFKELYQAMRSMGAQFRVNHRSWWKEELPSESEYEEARRNLEKAGNQVDYIVTHCAPNHIVDQLGNGAYAHDALTDFLQTICETTSFRHWLFGHYHNNRILEQRFVLLWEQIVRVW